LDRILTIFLDTLKRPATRQEYQRQLHTFLNYYKIKNFESLLTIHDEKLEEMVQTYMSYLKNTKKLKFSSCNLAKCALHAFFSINKKKIDWYIIGRHLPGKERPEGNKPYVNEDIKTMLANTTVLRDKALIHFIASTGCRVGAILDPSLKLKHTHDMAEGCKAIRLYEGSKEEYWGFLTPEASKSLDDYLDERQKNGEYISKDSSLFRLRQFPAKDFPITIDAIRSSLRPLTKLIKRQKDGNRYEKQFLLGYRHRFIEICIKKRLDYRLAEKMVSHSSKITPMDNFYTNIDSMRDELFNEFKKIIPDLTIDDSESLRLQNKIKDAKIEKLESDKDKRIANLESRFDNIEKLLEKANLVS
jgi:integrase/recombinase XerD